MEATYSEIKKLKVDALIGKKKHFNAADRKRRYRLWLNIPVIVLNILLGGSLIFSIVKEASPEVAKIFAALFSFIAAVMIWVSTFFNFAKQIEGHKKVGNKYLEVMKGCQKILALSKDDLIDKKELVNRFESLSSLNSEANRDAEAFHTNRKDYEKARNGIEEGEEEYLDRELDQ